MTDHKHAIDNAASWLITIHKLLAIVGASDIGDAEREEAETEIYQSPLSVQARCGWHDWGRQLDGEVEEVSILLSTGGPACRIHGTIRQDGGWDCELQWQDWGTPWTNHVTTHEDRAALERFADYFLA